MVKGLSSRRRLPGLAPLSRAAGRLAFSCGGWSVRRRRHPAVPRPAGTEGDGAAEAPSGSLLGVGPPVTAVPGFWGGMTCSRSSPQPGAAGRAALGVSPAVTGRGPRPPGLCPHVCLTGLLPRPPAPSCARGGFGGGSGQRRFRRLGIGQQENGPVGAAARCDAWVGSLGFCGWVCVGGYVCLF